MIHACNIYILCILVLTGDTMPCKLIKICREKIDYEHFSNYCNGEKHEECEYFKNLEDLQLRPSVWKKIVKEIGGDESEQSGG